MDLGERVWFPNKNHESDRGYELMEGKVVRVGKGYIDVELEERFHAQSQSGTPIISRESGKVIGTLVSYDERGGLPVISLAPSHALYEALNSGRQLMPLTEALEAEIGTDPD